MTFVASAALLCAQEPKVIRYSIPPARGNILLYSEAQNKHIPIASTGQVNYLGINFESVFDSSKEDVLKHGQEALGHINSMQAAYNESRKKFGLPPSPPVELTEHEIWEYFYGRRWIPMRVSNVLLTTELTAMRKRAWPISVELIPRKVRSYPSFQMAQHIIGRFSESSPLDWKREGSIKESDFLFPKQKAGMIEIETNGVKEMKRFGTGIESALNEILDNGQARIVEKIFSKKENVYVVEEKIIERGKAGASVVLTMDYELQRIAEDLVHDRYLKTIGDKSYSINTRAKKLPKAFVLIDLKDMSVAAMASSPSYDIQRFSPGFGEDNYDDKLRAMKKADGTDLRPLDSRAFELSYPPASTFKLITALAGLETQTITQKSKFQCTPNWPVGNRLMDNHCDEKEELGLSEDPFYNYSQAIKRSCNTWFYQLALAMNKDPQKQQRLFDIAKLFGFGVAPEIPIPGIAKGYMYSDINAIPAEDGKSTKKGLYPGEAANMFIGQGPVLASPLQVAWMSARLANPDSDRKLKIVKEIYYDVRQAPQKYEDYLASQGKSLRIEPLTDNIKRHNLALIQNAMYEVVNGANGTAYKVNAALDYAGLGPAVAAKTGTGEWGEKRDVVWLTGFFPFHAPRYAFAVFVEGLHGKELSGGGDAAPYLNAFLSDPLVQQRIEKHVANTEVLTGRLPPDDENYEPPRVLKALPVYEEPHQRSPYLREENKRDFDRQLESLRPMWNR